MNGQEGSGEMAQYLRALDIRSEDRGSIPAPTWQLITDYNPSSRRSGTLFWPPMSTGYNTGINADITLHT